MDVLYEYYIYINNKYIGGKKKHQHPAMMQPPFFAGSAGGPPPFFPPGPGGHFMGMPPPHFGNRNFLLIPFFRNLSGSKYNLKCYYHLSFKT
jgi:hypothetical protein